MTNKIGINFPYLQSLALVLIPTLLGSAARSAEPNAVTITTTKFEITDKALEWSYRITNGSDDDIWLCEGVGVVGFEVYLAGDSDTLMIRRRFGAPVETVTEPFGGSYVRLAAGRDRDESLVLPLPAYPVTMLASRGWHGDHTSAHSVMLEIDYHSGDLYQMVVDECEQRGGLGRDRADIRDERYSNLFFFARINEYTKNREERVILEVTHPRRSDGHILSLAIDEQNIPYVGKWPGRRSTPEPLGLISCTRIAIRYEPSMLEYFFPYSSQQSLLSFAELEYLRSQKNSVVEDHQEIVALARDIDKWRRGPIIALEAEAHLVGYLADQRLTSLIMCNGGSVRTEAGEAFAYGYGPESLREITPQILPFQLRLPCAGNLDALRRRLRLYCFTEVVRRRRSPGISDIVYPAPREWCSSLMRAYLRRSTMSGDMVMRRYKCPSAAEGKCHYAMNPNCRPDSARDMVLLFETEAGWNQHGGAELFTFDNHDPRGGCVLLNDGTVKFIRTDEELHALRWE